MAGLSFPCSPSPSPLQDFCGKSRDIFLLYTVSSFVGTGQMPCYWQNDMYDAGVLELDMMNLVLLDCCVLQGLMLELGPAGLIDEEKDNLTIQILIN